MTIDKRDVTFKSGGSFAAGWFFLPEHAGSGTAVPAVAMAHGIGAVKEMFLAAFARAGEPKRLLEVEGGHYSVYPWSKGQSWDQASQAATDWFTEHLLAPTAVRNGGTGLTREPDRASR